MRLALDSIYRYIKCVGTLEAKIGVQIGVLGRIRDCVWVVVVSCRHVVVDRGELFLY